MSDVNRTTALRVFSRLMREPAFRKVLRGSRAVVCLESDTVDSMLNALTMHYPDGAQVAIYYPEEHCFRFMWWSLETEPGDDGLDAHAKTTLGMAIAATRAEQHDWAQQFTQAYSTTEVEKQLTSV